MTRASWKGLTAAGCAGVALVAVVLAVALSPGSSAADAGTASNRAAALSDASSLLGRLTLPSGATTVTPGEQSQLPGLPVFRPATPTLVDRVQDWTVSQSLQTVRRYVTAHLPAGTRLVGTASAGGPGTPENASLTFASPRPPAGIGSEQLIVDLVANGRGETAVRADAQVAWLVERAAAERVPAGVREVDVTRAVPGRSPTASVSVTSPPQVAAIVRLIDRLPVVQPGATACPAQFAQEPQVRFVFRARVGGPVLAVAAEPADVREPTTSCAPLSFSVRGRRMTPLLRGAAFLRAVQRLTHVALSAAPFAA